MSKSRSKTLYVFIDESGNFDFSDKGSKHFVLTAVSSFAPLHKRTGLLHIRHDLLANGHDQEFFHASEDKQFVRDKVFGFIGSLEGVTADAVIARKHEIGGLMRMDDALYGMMLNCLLNQIFHRHEQTDVKDVVVVVGALFTGRKREFILKRLNVSLKQITTKEYHIYFHRVIADINCQIADYCGWAIYVAFERGEARPLKAIEGLRKHKFQVF